MHLDHLALRLEKMSVQSGLKYALGEPTSSVDILQTEKLLDVSFPTQVMLFYENLNGLQVSEPKLEILPIEKLNFVSEHRLHFATFDGNQQIFFDTSHLNNADQWDIVTDEGFCVTLTMASFWSNKIWRWIERKKKIWLEEFPNEQAISE